MHEEIFVHQDELGGKPGGPGRFNWRKIRKVLLWVLGIIFLLGVLYLGYLALTLSKVSVNPFGFGKLKGESDGRTNIMLLGVGDPGHDGENLSDTNIILSVDTRNHKVALIGIPRDTRVRIPGYGYSKINNANAQGGVKTAKQVYENNFGVPIHYYVKANFTGLKEVVDAVGGVDVTNDTLLYDPEYPCDKNQYKSCGYKLKPGQYHLNGTEALKYVRCRKGTCGDDFGRAQRQQQVMESIRDRATSAGTLANPVALGKLVKAVGDNIETDLSITNMLRLNELTKGVNKDNVINVVFNMEPDGFLVASKDSSDLLPADGNFDDIKNFVTNIFKLGPIWSEHPTVMIENGTTTPGLAGQLQEKISDDGYNINVLSVTNALKRDYQTTQIIDYTGGKRPNTINYFQNVLKVQASAPPQAVKTPPADIVIILGSDFASTSGSSTGTSTTR